MVPFSRPYPLTPRIIVGLVYGDGKMPHPHLSVIFALVIGNGPAQVRGKCRGAGVRERNGKSCKKPQSDKTSRDLNKAEMEAAEPAYTFVRLTKQL